MFDHSDQIHRHICIYTYTVYKYSKYFFHLLYSLENTANTKATKIDVEVEQIQGIRNEAMVSDDA